MSQYPAEIDLGNLNGRNGFKLNGAAKDDRSGTSVASAGDVNGDGFADIIIGAPNADPYGNNSGASYVVYGKDSGFAPVEQLALLDGTNGFQLIGAPRGDQSGRSVASAGDINGDGFVDLLIGAWVADPHGFPSGATYVVFGQAPGFGAKVDLSSLDGTNGFVLNGVDRYDGAGFSVSSAGDINGDGFADLMVGAAGANPNGPNSGASYVVFGKGSGFAASLDLSTLDGTNGFRLSGVKAYEHNGYSVASAGDINGDGFADMIVGAPSFVDDLYGANYVVFGKASGFAANVDLSTLDGSNGFKLKGARAHEENGFSVSSAGDINGDGFADLIVGARDQAGYVVFGKASGFAAETELSDLDGSDGFRIHGENSPFVVAFAGDVNGDGFSDVIVGCFGAISFVAPPTSSSARNRVSLPIWIYPASTARMASSCRAIWPAAEADRP